MLEFVVGAAAAILAAKAIAPYNPGNDVAGLPTPWVLTGQASAVRWGCVTLAALAVPVGIGAATRHRAWPPLCAAVAETSLIAGVALGIWWAPTQYPAFYRGEGREDIIIHAAAGGFVGLLIAAAPAFVAAVVGVWVGRRRARSQGALRDQHDGFIPHPAVLAAGAVVVVLIGVVGVLAVCVLMAANF